MAGDASAQRRTKPSHDERIVDGLGRVGESEAAVKVHEDTELHAIVAVRALDVEPVLPAGGDPAAGAGGAVMRAAAHVEQLHED